MEEPTFYRDTWVEVDLDCIYENVENMKRHVKPYADVMAVVKADGYGHGAVSVAKTALEAGATRLAVALLEEAILLRRAGLDVPILVMGRVRPRDIKVAMAFNVTVTAFQLEWFLEASKVMGENDIATVHLKFDTGMGRIGLKNRQEIEEIVTFVKKDKRFDVEGVFTHFATADENDKAYFDFQYSSFKEMLQWLFESDVNPRYIHCGNSATGLKFPDQTFQAVRYGISMYGLTPSPDMTDDLPFPLKQAFSLHSKITQVKLLNKGEKVSYGGTYEAQEQEWIGTLPIGYADGWLRRLNKASVLVDGRRCPIVGRICMDQLMIRLDQEVPVGTKATLIGKQGNDEITVDEIAALLETINYEVTCMISYRVPRMIYRKKRIIEEKHYFGNSCN